MKMFKYCLLIALVGLVFSTQGLSAELAGLVKTVQGDVNIFRGDKSVAAKVGSPVFASDKVTTGENSSVGIMLRDNTQLSAGDNSVLELNKFSFNTTTHAGKLDATVKRGTLSVISGKLAKSNPDSVKFNTSAVTLGVRGTEFIIEAADREGE